MPVLRRSLAVVAAVLALAACSEKGPPAASPDGVSAATTTTAPTFTGAGREPFCSRVRTAQERLAKLQASATTPDAVREQFTQAADSVRALADVAPAEIAPDVRTLVGVYDAIIAGLQRSEWDLSKLPPATREQIASVAVRSATDRLESYQRQVCGTS